MFRVSSLSVAVGLLCVAHSPVFGAPAPPVFSPHPSVGWVAMLGGLKPPRSGPGPVKEDPEHPTIDNNQFRLTGKQPTLPVADLRNPILQPWGPMQSSRRASTSEARDWQRRDGLSG